MLVDNASQVLGLDKVVQLAEEAEAAGEFWFAACRWAAAGKLSLSASGQKEAGDCCVKSLDAIGRVETDRQGRDLKRRCTELDRDRLELVVTIRALAGFDKYIQDKVLPNLARLLDTSAAAEEPVIAFAAGWQSNCVPNFIAGDCPKLSAGLFLTIKAAMTQSQTHPDKRTRQMLTIEGIALQGWMTGLLAMCPEWSWELHPRETLLEVIEIFEYEKHHSTLVDLFNADLLCTAAGPALGLFVHYGDIDSCDTWIDKAVEYTKMAANEPDQNREAIGLCFGPLNLAFFFYEIGRKSEAVALLNSLGATYTGADDRYDKLVEANAWLRRRGNSEKDTSAMLAVEPLMWWTKFLFALCTTWREVPHDELIAMLPSPSMLAETGTTFSNGVNFLAMFAPVTICAALVCEMLGRADDALAFADDILTRAVLAGGSPLCDHIVRAHAVRGRVLAGQGRRHEAVLAFEAALTEAEKHGFLMLAAMVLRDEKKALRDEQATAKINRKLGAIVRRFTPSDRLSRVLGEDCKKVAQY
eukprot:SAG22_NODE_247_length_13918_cov_7.885375_5_plen_528_part_00